MPDTPPDIATIENTAAVLAALWDHTPAGVTPTQLRALRILERRPGLTTGQFAAKLAVSPSSASRLSDRLQAAGLIVCTRTPGTPASRLHLTREGTTLLHQHRHQQLTCILARMQAHDRAALLAGLRCFQHTAQRQRGPLTLERQRGGAAEVGEEAAMGDHRRPEDLFSRAAELKNQSARAQAVSAMLMAESEALISEVAESRAALARSRKRIEQASARRTAAARERARRGGHSR